MRTLTIFLALALIGVILWGLNDRASRASEYARKESASKVTQDSLKRLYSETALYAMGLATQLNLEKADKRALEARNATLIKRHEIDKRKPVPMLGDSAVSTELSNLWPR